MQRKTQRKVNTLNFALKARNLVAKEVILQKAKQQKVRVNKAKRPKLRLHFACPPLIWQRFHRAVKPLCEIESPVTCCCPQRLQKIARKNLYAAAHNGRVSPVRARRASEILAGLGSVKLKMQKQSAVLSS